MKLALYDDFHLGIIKGEKIADVGEALGGINYHNPQELMEMVITGWDEIGPKIEQAAGLKEGMPLDGVQLRPPMPRPGQLVCLAGNYLEPAHPDRMDFNAFLKANTSVIGQNGTVELPPAEAKVFHFEPELALVIGKKADRISAAEVMD